MKRLIIICAVVWSACGAPRQEGVFVAHGKNEYSVADDTLIIENGVVTNHVGYNRIRNGALKPRQFSLKQWRLNEAFTPVIIFKSDGLTLSGSFYKRVK